MRLLLMISILLSSFSLTACYDNNKQPPTEITEPNLPEETTDPEVTEPVQPANSAPVVTSGFEESYTLISGRELKLTPRMKDAEGDQISVEWKQLSGPYPLWKGEKTSWYLTLFTLPSTPETQQAFFDIQLTVSDATGSNTYFSTIEVNPKPLVPYGMIENMNYFTLIEKDEEYELASAEEQEKMIQEALKAREKTASDITLSFPQVPYGVFDPTVGKFEIHLYSERGATLRENPQLATTRDSSSIFALGIDVSFGKIANVVDMVEYIADQNLIRVKPDKYQEFVQALHQQYIKHQADILKRHRNSTFSFWNQDSLGRRIMYDVYFDYRPGSIELELTPGDESIDLKEFIGEPVCFYATENIRVSSCGNIDEKGVVKVTGLAVNYTYKVVLRYKDRGENNDRYTIETGEAISFPLIKVPLDELHVKKQWQVVNHTQFVKREM